MTTIAAGLDMMRRRSDFVAAAESGVKIGGPLIALQMRDRGTPDDNPRVGFTVTKRVGHAVERNRMKRRLREAARATLRDEARAGFDYVLVARRAVLDARFDRLLRDLRDAVKRAHGRADKSSAAKNPDPTARDLAGGGSAGKSPANGGGTNPSDGRRRESGR